MISNMQFRILVEVIFPKSQVLSQPEMEIRSLPNGLHSYLIEDPTSEPT